MLPNQTPPTLAEAERMPTFWRIQHLHETNYQCEDCAEHRRESWVDGTACERHRKQVVVAARVQTKQRRTYSAGVPHPDCWLALAVLRAGGNPEPQFADGTMGAAQFAYRRRGNKAAWSVQVRALTYARELEAVA